MKLPLSFTCGAICASYVLLPHIALSQTCYYPNGDISTSDYPCTDQVDGICCPPSWQCLTNGLCYLENEQYYGRYTCTDQTWQSPQCPDYCTDGNSDSGDQAVLQCSGHGGDWCCDHNRSASNVCCDSSNSNDFFPLSEGFPISGGTSVASISTTGPAVPSADIIGNPINGDTATTASSETSSTSSSTSPTPTPTSTTKNAGGGAAVQSPTSLVSVISVVSIVTSAANGDLITTTNMIMQTVPPTPTPSPSSSSSPHLGAEIGGAVAGALALIALISLAFLLLRRRKKKQQYHTAPTTEYRNSMDYMYKHNDTSSPRTAETSPEIDGTPIVGVYRGWGPEGGAALRVVNGSDHRQSGVSGLTGANGRESLMSELESPGSPGWGGGRGMERTMREQPFELAGEGGR